MTIIDKIDERADQLQDERQYKERKNDTRGTSERRLEIHAFTKDVAQQMREWFRTNDIQFNEVYHFNTYHFFATLGVYYIVKLVEWVEENEIPVNL